MIFWEFFSPSTSDRRAGGPLFVLFNQHCLSQCLNCSLFASWETDSWEDLHWLNCRIPYHSSKVTHSSVISISEQRTTELQICTVQEEHFGETSGLISIFLPFKARSSQQFARAIIESANQTACEAPCKQLWYSLGTEVSGENCSSAWELGKSNFPESCQPKIMTLLTDHRWLTYKGQNGGFNTLSIDSPPLFTPSPFHSIPQLLRAWSQSIDVGQLSTHEKLNCADCLPA